MIFFILTAIITLVSVFFIYSKLKKNVVTTRENEIQSYYKIFINFITNEYEIVSITSLKEKSVILKTARSQNSYIIILTKVQGRIIIVWTWSNERFGQRGKEWSYSYQYDQLKMWTEIKEDIHKYEISMYQKYNVKNSSKVKKD